VGLTGPDKEKRPKSKGNRPVAGICSLDPVALTILHLPRSNAFLHRFGNFVNTNNLVNCGCGPFQDLRLPVPLL
jgi:hypothetical protein